MSFLKILIVEKNPILSHQIQNLIQPFGMQIDIFKHGFYAFGAMKKFHYDVAIINEDLKVENGFFIAKGLKRIDPQIKIILFSKHGLHPIYHLLANHGHYFLLEKLTDLAIIRDQVKSLLA